MNKMKQIMTVLTISLTFGSVLLQAGYKPDSDVVAGAAQISETDFQDVLACNTPDRTSEAKCQEISASEILDAPKGSKAKTALIVVGSIGIAATAAMAALGALPATSLLALALLL